MNELDLLKTYWQKDNDYIKFKKEDIVKMVHKSSSSIVKWIFIISLAEFLILSGINIASFIREPDTFKKYDMILSLAYLPIMMIFIYLFYRHFSTIKNSSNSKVLMSSILRAKKQTIYFIITNFIFFAINMFFGFISGDVAEAYLKGYYGGSDIPEPINKPDIIGAYIGISLAAVIVFSLVYLYYKLVYIRLTSKLQNNYEELLKIEQQY